MPKKRKKNTQNLNPQQSRPAVSKMPAEPNLSPTDTPTSSSTPVPPPTPEQKPKTSTPALFTESQRDELFTMTERDATAVARARMNEVFPDDENENIKQQLAAAEALYSQNQRRSTEQRSRRLRDAAWPRRGRPTIR